MYTTSATLHWHEVSDNHVPVIPEGKNLVQVLYRPTSSERMGIVTITPQMVESIAKWNYVVKLFHIDQWAYTSEIIKPWQIKQ